MNDLTTQPPSQFNGSRGALTVELAKMLGLVAPVTMSADQQTLWLASAVEALEGISPSEVEQVSFEVRRLVTRPSQIVPEIAKLVAERRSKAQHDREFRHAHLPPPPIKKDVMDRRGQPMSDEDTAELNARLESLGATARYRSDGSRYLLA